MTEERFAELLQLYLQQKIAVEHLEDFLTAAADPTFEHLVKLHLDDDLLSPSAEVIDADELALISYSKFKSSLAQSAPAPAIHRVHLLRTAWFKYVAAVLIATGVGVYIWFNSPKNMLRPVDSLSAIDSLVQPKEGIILTLADGSTIMLDSMNNGTIATQNGGEVILKDGQVVYRTSEGLSVATAYNTMATPKGKQFKIELPDGTKAWLNSSSSIKYPTVFSGRERSVEVTGEVYFEVASDAKRPFKVNANHQADILVLGTSFNINAYSNEPAIKTTVLSGSIRLKYKQDSAILQPGQQAFLNTGNHVQLTKNADINKVMAWKNGYFNFNGADIFEVMRQLERWYDIEVEFAKPMGPIKFEGELQRDLSFSQILKILREMEVHYTLENGRKIIIQP